MTELTGMAAIVATMGSVVTSAASWVTTVVGVVTANPLLLLTCGLAITGTAIGFFRSLR